MLGVIGIAGALVVGLGMTETLVKEEAYDEGHEDDALASRESSIRR